MVTNCDWLLAALCPIQNSATMTGFGFFFYFFYGEKKINADENEMGRKNKRLR